MKTVDKAALLAGAHGAVADVESAKAGGGREIEKKMKVKSVGRVIARFPPGSRCFQSSKIITPGIKKKALAYSARAFFARILS